MPKHRKNSGSMIIGTACLSSLRIRDSRDAFLAVKEWLRLAREHVSAISSSPHHSGELWETTRKFYCMMLEDPTLEEDVLRLMETEDLNPEMAFNRYFDQLIGHLSEKDSYFAERVFDLEDLRQLILSRPTPESNFGHPLPAEAIIMTPVLLASELMSLDINRIQAVIAGRGGYNSHAAILLRSLNIPLFILGTPLQPTRNGDRIRIHRKDGKITRNSRFWMNLRHEDVIGEGTLVPSRVIPENIQVFPCVSSLDEARRISPYTISGIGLVRTEIPLLIRNRFWTETEMEIDYRDLARQLDGKPVNFRLWDFEPDKRPPGIADNLYGIPFLLAHPDLAKTQIRALMRVAIDYPLGITLPMVRLQIEIDKVWTLIHDCQIEIANVTGGKRPRFNVGIMVETIEIIPEISTLHGVDYLIIGTNDLMCSLKGRCREDDGFDFRWFSEPDFLNTVSAIVGQAKSAGFPLFLCGEAANDDSAVSLLAQLGVQAFCPGPAGMGLYPSVKASK